MPIFEVQGPNGKYEIDAPDMQSAVAGLGKGSWTDYQKMSDAELRSAYEGHAASMKPETAAQKLQVLRKQYPQYDDISDADFTSAVHKKFYSDIPKARFDALLSLPPGYELDGPWKNYQQPATSDDILKSAGVGAVKGAIGLFGAPGDLAEWGARGLDRATRFIGDKIGVDVARREDRPATYGSADITKALEPITGKLYEPQSTAGKYAQTVGEFVPAMFGGGGGLLGKLVTRAVIPGVASEAAGQATEGTAAEPFARFGGALAGGLAAGGAVNAASSTLNAARNTGPVSRTPANFETVGNVKVPLDRGQANGDVVAQRLVETGRQGNFGPAAQKEVNTFRDLQGQGVENAKQDIRGTLGGAEATPLEAADIVQQGVMQKAAQAKAAYQNKYDQFGSMNGEVHAGAFEGLGQKIKGDLSMTNHPVIIDDRITPAASALIQHIDNGISKMKIQNRADPFGQPNPENVVGISLKGIDQFRKQMLSIAGGAANPTDSRAARAVISSFDDRLQKVVDSHLYRGDPNAFGTLKDARKLFADYAQTFRSKGSGDMAGRVVENMLGKFGQPATHNEIVNWLYGASKIGGNKEAGHVADKLRGILGDGTPEWQTIRQGLFSKLVDTTEGKIAEGPQKISQRVAEFLNGTGKQFAEKVYTPQELALIGQYGELMRKMTPLPGAVNHSGSGYQIASMMKWTLNSLATLGGLHVGGPVGALAGVAANTVGKGLIEGTHARNVARHLYHPGAAPGFARTRQPRGAVAGRSSLAFTDSNGN